MESLEQAVLKPRSMIAVDWESFEVGESRFVDLAGESRVANKEASIRNRASLQGRNLNFKFSVRREGTGIRIWRTA